MQRRSQGGKLLDVQNPNLNGLLELSDQEGLLADLSELPPQNLDEFRERIVKDGDLGSRVPSLFIFNTTEDLDRFTNGLMLLIHQRVFFLSLSDGMISERYSIGGETVSTDLWKFARDLGRFVEVDGVTTDLLERRSNFRGESLDVVVDLQAPYLNLLNPEGEREVVERDGMAYDALPPETLTGLFNEVNVRNKIKNQKTLLCLSKLTDFNFYRKKCSLILTSLASFSAERTGCGEAGLGTEPSTGWWGTSTLVALTSSARA